MSSHLFQKLQDYFPKYPSFWKAAFEMYTEIDALLQSSQKRPILIVVTGGPGSGKTTFSTMIDFLLETHNQSGVVLSSDDFFLSEEQLKAQGISWRGVLEGHDGVKLKHVLDSFLSKKLPVDVPVFDHSINSTGKPVRIEKMPEVILLEGSVSAALIHNLYGDVKKIADRLIYMDMSQEDMKHRCCERKNSLTSEQEKGLWESDIIPAFQKRTKPFREKADRVFGFKIEEGEDLKYV